MVLTPDETVIIPKTVFFETSIDNLVIKTDQRKNVFPQFLGRRKLEAEKF